MIENILIFKFDDSNDLNTCFTEYIIEGLQNNINVVYVDLDDFDSSDVSGLNYTNTCIFTINSECIYLMRNHPRLDFLRKNLNIHEFILFDFWMDHPVHRKNTVMYGIENPFKKCVTLCNDENWIKFIDKYYKNYKTDVFYLGGKKSEIDIPYQEKEDSVIFTGTLNRQNVTYISSIFKFNEICTELIYNPDTLIEDLFEKYKVPKKHEYFAAIDEYIRTYFREKIFIEIAKSGVPFSIIGSGCDFLKTYDNVKLIKYVPGKKVVEEINKRKILIHVMPWTKCGPHDRVFDAMLNGTLAITDKSKYLERNYVNKESIIFHDLKYIGQTARKVSYYFEHPEKAEKIANTGKEIAIQKDSWKCRAITLIDIIHKWNLLLNH